MARAAAALAPPLLCALLGLLALGQLASTSSSASPLSAALLAQFRDACTAASPAADATFADACASLQRVASSPIQPDPDGEGGGLAGGDLNPLLFTEHPRHERRRSAAVAVPASLLATLNSCGTLCRFDGSVANCTMTKFEPLVNAVCNPSLREYMSTYATVIYFTSTSDEAVVRDLLEAFKVPAPHVTALYIDAYVHEEVILSIAEAFPNVATLNLTNAFISQMTQDLFSRLGSLTSLNIAGNTILSIDENTFANNTGLQTLVFSQNSIDDIPMGLFASLTALLDLQFSFNEVAALSDGVFDPLENLRSLVFSRNAINNLPERLFSRLSSLEILDMAFNQISEIPVAIFSPLTRITRILLQGNRIASIPESAFAGLNLLAHLNIESNIIESLSANLFRELTSLAYLDFQDNEIRDLPPSIFKNLHALETIDARENVISTLPSGLFSSNLRLETIALGDNAIATLPTNLFDGLTRVTHLFLHGNRVESLPPGLLDKMHLLQELRLERNRITMLNQGVFDGLVSLELLGLQSNRLEELPDQVFSRLSNLTVLYMFENRLRHLRPGVFAACFKLRELLVFTNRISQVDPNMFAKVPGLRHLRLDNNTITAVPQTLFRNLSMLRELAIDVNNIEVLPAGVFDSLASLTELYFGNNSIKSVPASAFARLSQLEVLDMGSNKLETLDPLLFAPLGNLSLLNFGYNEIKSVSKQMFATLSKLKTLVFKGNKISGLESGIFDKLTSLVSLIAHDNKLGSLPEGIFDNMPELGMVKLANMKLSVAPSFRSNDRVKMIDLSSNEIESFPDFPSSVEFLNMSSNPRFSLTQQILNLANLLTLDVSYTLVSGERLECDNDAQLLVNPGDDGSRDPDAGVQQKRFKLLQALSMHFVGEDETLFLEFAKTCLPVSDLFDISGNDLENIAYLQHILADIRFDVPVSRDDSSQNTAFSQLELGSTNPVQCGLEIRTFPRPFLGINTFLASLVYVCECNNGYQPVDATCEKVPPSWTSQKVAMLVIGIMFLTMGGMVVGRRIHKRHKRVRVELELQKLLLDETTEEVIALKRAWEISATELVLESRIDLEAPGAFGEVWRAKWEGITVAVKMLHLHLMSMDGKILDEFQKEVEFLQRTRHPNIVRFFGAGRWNNGVPFLVLEYVAKGSLRTCLRGKSSSKEVPNVPWDLKLSLATDIARGMEYIHSLGQMHRDLKSGNVLITEQNRAKITDFGTIRELLISGTQSGSDRPLRRMTLSLALEMTAGKGTPLYMSPEVMDGGEYDLSADVWSFAILLWEIAAQTSPDLISQEGRNKGPMLINLSKLYTEGKRLRVSPMWPPWICGMMQRCWSEDAQLRPPFSEIVSVLAQLDHNDATMRIPLNE